MPSLSCTTVIAKGFTLPCTESFKMRERLRTRLRKVFVKLYRSLSDWNPSKASSPRGSTVAANHASIAGRPPRRLELPPSSASEWEVWGASDRRWLPLRLWGCWRGKRLWGGSVAASRICRTFQKKGLSAPLLSRSEAREIAENGRLQSRNRQDLAVSRHACHAARLRRTEDRDETARFKALHRRRTAHAFSL